VQNGSVQVFINDIIAMTGITMIITAEHSHSKASYVCILSYNSDASHIKPCLAQLQGAATRQFNPRTVANFPSP